MLRLITGRSTRSSSIRRDSRVIWQSAQRDSSFAGRLTPSSADEGFFVSAFGEAGLESKVHFSAGFTTAGSRGPCFGGGERPTPFASPTSPLFANVPSDLKLFAMRQRPWRASVQLTRPHIPAQWPSAPIHPETPPLRALFHFGCSFENQKGSAFRGMRRRCSHLSSTTAASARPNNDASYLNERFEIRKRHIPGDPLNLEMLYC